MAHIFKRPSKTSRGIVILTHKELKYFGGLATSSKWSFFSTTPLDKLILLSKKDYFFGVHFGWYHPKPIDLPSWVHFALAADSIAQFTSAQMIIPLSSSHFTPKIMVPKPVEKYWDIVCVAKATKAKNLDLFLREIRKIYDLGYNYRVLLLVASNQFEQEMPNMYATLVDDYYELFSASEREYFTLLKTDASLGFQGLSYSVISHFLNQSRVFTLFSQREGASKAVKEALLCGLPVVAYSGLEGGALNPLDNTNSVLFDDFEDAHLALIEAVKGSFRFNVNSNKLRGEIGEVASLELLKAYFSELFEQYGQEFDGELINTDNLNRRLPAHFYDGSLPWAAEKEFRMKTTDISTELSLKQLIDDLAF